MKLIDLTGEVFGRWTVAGRSADVGKQPAWDCVCQCGAEGVVQGQHLRSGRSSSCGCLANELTSTRCRTEQPSYLAVHKRIWRERGKAAYLGCVDCAAPAAEWSYDHTDPDELVDQEHPYSLKPEHYSPRCIPCHRSFDQEHAKEMAHG